MKNKLIALTLSLVGLTSNGAEQELVKGVDFTGLTGFTPATLNQLVDNAVPASNRGLVIKSATTPDTATYPRFTNYLWQDISALPYTLKSYQTGSWVSATIGANAIGTANIQDGAVTSVKIANATIVATNISTGAIVTSLLSDGGVTGPKIASGTISNVHLSSLSVATGNLQDNSVTTVKINDAAVTGAKIASGSISNSHLASSFTVYGTNIAANSIANSNLQANAVQATNIVDGVISKAKLSFALYTNTSPAAVAIPAAAGTASITHGCGGAPQIVRVVLVNTSTDVGWAVNDEVSIHSFSSSSTHDTVFSVYVDATTVKVLRVDDASDLIDIPNKSTGVRAAIDTAKWQIKAYCVYYP